MTQVLRDSDPARIGEYALESRLGEGGMGVVYLARDRAGNPVAVKVIQRGLLEGDAGITRFRREIAALRRLDRFCTARLIDADAGGDPPYLVTEFVSGPDLKEAVYRDGPLAGPDLESVAMGIAAALRHIHRAGITHRDLKPANVLLSPYGPRVIDFGLALHSEVSRRVTSGFIVGTPGYMAPEQLSVGEDIGGPADVFAWGAVVAFAATGRPPFGRGTIREVSFRVITGTADLNGLDGPLRDIVMDALTKEPSGRPTAGELVDRLRHLGSTERVLTSAAQGPSEGRQADGGPFGAAGWAERAGRALAEGKPQLARFRAQRGIALEPHHARCHWLRGRALRELGEEDEARAALRLAHEIDPADEEIARSYAPPSVPEPNAPEPEPGTVEVAPSVPDPNAPEPEPGTVDVAPNVPEPGAVEPEQPVKHVLFQSRFQEEERLRALLGQGTGSALAEAFELAPQDGTVADRYVRHLLETADPEKAVDRIVSLWDEAPPATRAAVWEQLPRWLEKRYPKARYDAARALKQELTIGRLLDLRPPRSVARRLWRLKRAGFEKRAEERAVNVACVALLAIVVAGVLELVVRHVGWVQRLVVVGGLCVLGLVVLITIGFLAGALDDRRRKAFLQGGLRYPGDQSSTLPSNFPTGPDYGKARDHAVMLRPFVADRPR